ncbi:tetratricopeptide repeat protein [Moorena producens]|uniref:tetratricopeptide repeat protein n=1 Tax=Moorena producens TaxID=1155739 RepID=UPI0018759928|nr:tetratricopeptide repeat protein [Moorena producens]
MTQEGSLKGRYSYLVLPRGKTSKKKKRGSGIAGTSFVSEDEMRTHTPDRYSEAEPLYRQALEIAVQQLGEDHPNTQTISRNLSRLLDQS